MICLNIWLRLVSLLGLTITLNCALALAQIAPQRYLSPEHQLSFSYDAAFTQQVSGGDNQVVLLGIRERTFPQFEVQKIAKEASARALSAKEFAEQQVGQLAVLGIADSKVLDTQRYPIAGKDVWVTEVRYPYEDKVLLAAIAVVDSEQQSYRIIYRDIVAGYFRHKPLRNQIFDSFQIGPFVEPTLATKNVSTSTLPPSDRGVGPETMVVCAIILLILGLIVYQRTRK